MSSVWSIRRSVTDKRVAGVCGGVARHWGVDPILVRVGWLLLALSGGVGVVLYLAAWLLIPVDDAAASVMDGLTKGATSGWSREAWVAIVAVVCLLTFAAFGRASFGFVPAVVLALIWYFGYYKTRVNHLTPPRYPPAQRPPDQASPAQYPPAQPPSQGALQPPPSEPFQYPGPATPFTEAAEAWRQRVQDVRGGAPAQAPIPGPAQAPVPTSTQWPVYHPEDPSAAAVRDPASPEQVEASARSEFLAMPDPVGLYAEPTRAEAQPTPTRRTRAGSPAARRLRLVSLVTLGLTLLGLAIADQLGLPITPLIYAAAALLVIGLTLVVATWLGRAAGILPIGLLVLLLVLAASAAVPASRYVHQFGYTSVSQLPTQPVSVDRGLVRIDLSKVELTSDADVAADLGTGVVLIQVPSEANLLVDYRIGEGTVLMDGSTIATGSNLNETFGSPPPGRTGENLPTLAIDLDVGQGMVVIIR